jgi:serine/threonine protein kinase
MDSDLECLIRDRAAVISAADVKAYMRAVLLALDACHRQWVLHRDIKPSNFLISVSGKSLYVCVARFPVHATACQSHGRRPPSEVANACLGIACMHPLCVSAAARQRC